MTSPARTLPGKLTVCLVHDNAGTDRFRLEVEDAQAHITFLSLEISPEELALALAGRGYRPCTLEVNGLDKVGLAQEHKAENLPAFTGALPADPAKRLALLNEWVRPWEVDGWRGFAPDLTNDHNRQPDGTYRVGFVRWVTPAAPPRPPESFGAGNLRELVMPEPVGSKP